MKQNLFFIIVCLLCCFSCNAQSQDTTTNYATEAAAVQGYTKSAARYRDPSGQSHAVVIDAAGNVFFVAYSCKRGYFRQPINTDTVSATD